MRITDPTASSAAVGVYVVFKSAGFEKVPEPPDQIPVITAPETLPFSCASAPAHTVKSEPASTTATPLIEISTSLDTDGQGPTGSFVVIVRVTKPEF